MPLASGTRLGPYEIIAPLGAGGMGEVYRARDTRLNRTVAVKILPQEFSSDPVLKQRFEREAKTISRLNHPNICVLHDVGSQDGVEYLVMECVEGETLAKRLEKGALPLDQALKFGTQMAAALDAAHRSGVVHRDLKPGNIMLTSTGVKLLDFGLAKAAAPLDHEKTLTAAAPATPITQEGSIIGTFQYMSPEQLEGKELDGRSDIFSLGAVLYEMATGKRAFEGQSPISVASAILEKEPEPLRARNRLAPAALDYLVGTCLVKDREARIQSAHDVQLQLKGISLSQDAEAARAPEEIQRRLSLGVLLTGVALLLAGGGIGYISARRGTAPELSVRSYIPPPPGTAFRASGFDAGPVVVSPDGKTMAFSAVDEKGVTNLWLRVLEAQQATMLPGTEDAASPFWSPDSRYIGFFADGKLKKISASGGETQILADKAASSGGSWNADGTILFCKELVGPISRVEASGGAVSPVTKLSKTETRHLEPFFLPDGKHFLYATMRLEGPEEIKAGELGKPEEDGIVVGRGGLPQFASGKLLHVLEGHIDAQTLNLRTWQLAGDPQSLGEARYYSVSANGVLAYHESSAESELRIYDRSGNVMGTPGAKAYYSAPQFSPDGKSVAVTVEDPKTGTRDIWVYPTAGGQPARITFGPDDYWPVWSPDGKEIAYGVDENGKKSIRRRPLDGHGAEETLYTNDAARLAVAIDWSPDGKFISINVQSKQGVFSIWIVPAKGGGHAFRATANTAAADSEYAGRYSLDGRWLAYFSNETGRPEVYVAPFPPSGSKYQVSTTGGWVPRFGPNELYYITLGNLLMAAEIRTEPSFHVDSIRPLFQVDFPNFAAPLLDVSPDGRRFAVLTADRTKSTFITLVTNWPVELKR